MEKTAIQYPKGYRPRRAKNWISIGLMYASFYLMRYNFPIASKKISDEFHLSNQELGWIITAMFWAYALGQMINGLLADRFGGKKIMIIGAVGTIIMNLIFGAGAYIGSLSFFIIVWMLNGYVQAAGAPGMVKINTAWFAPTERGKFSGIFGFMIQIGRFAITGLGGFLIMRAPWQWLFWLPAVIAFVVLIIFIFFVKDTPEEAGLESIVKEDDDGNEELTMSQLVKRIVLNRVVWIIASAYFATGITRYGIDMWFPKYLQEVFNISLDSAEFQILAILIPAMAVLGSLISGIISDHYLHGRRAPVAAILYYSQIIFILIGFWFTGPIISSIILLILVMLINGTHSLLGSAAAMDIGGKKAAGFASGVIDAMQYVGAGLAGFGMGMVLDTFSWNGWLISLSGFSLLGGILMTIIWNEGKPKKA